jgi:hypothetical protein
MKSPANRGRTGPLTPTFLLAWPLRTSLIVGTGPRIQTRLNCVKRFWHVGFAVHGLGGDDARRDAAGLQ